MNSWSLKDTHTHIIILLLLQIKVLTLNNSPLDGDFCWKKASAAYLEATSLPKGFTKPVKNVSSVASVWKYQQVDLSSA